MDIAQDGGCDGALPINVLAVALPVHPNSLKLWDGRKACIAGETRTGRESDS
jgi:hypothetical protein